MPDRRASVSRAAAAAAPESLWPGLLEGCCAALLKDFGPVLPPPSPSAGPAFDEQFQCVNSKFTGSLCRGHGRWDRWGDPGVTAVQGMLQPACVLSALPELWREPWGGAGGPHWSPCFPPHSAQCPGCRMQGGEQMEALELRLRRCFDTNKQG